MLHGPTIDLRIAEESDAGLLQEWDNDLGFVGDYEPFAQSTLAANQDQLRSGKTPLFLVVTRDGTPTGYVAYFSDDGNTSIGYTVKPEHRGSGYCSEAVQMLVDYIFLNKDVVRIQAETHPGNAASIRVLEKAQFSFEGIRRQAFFSRGVWRDTAMYSILRTEWSSPSILPLGG